VGLSFIIGPAGSGKTAYILDSIAKLLTNTGDAARMIRSPDSGSFRASEMPRDRSILFIVPDQATFQMEKAILSRDEIPGFIDLHILSFRRLCLRVLEETGGVSHPFITPVGKSMAIQHCLWKRRKDLSIFAPMVDYPGFRDALSNTLSELHAYDIAPQDLLLEDIAGAGPFLPQKLHDLRILYQEYRNFLENRFFDPDDYLDLAAPRMAESRLVRGSFVYIDGFSGFTPKEYKVIKSLLKHAEEVSVALCMDREEINSPVSEVSLFHPIREVYEKIRDLASQSGVLLREPVFCPEEDIPRFRESPLLSGLERTLRARKNAFEAEEMRSSAPPKDEIQLVAASNPRAEVEFLAREILHLVRDEGLRYRDITVELRDLERYSDLISFVFRDHGIPFFLDKKRSLGHHPLAELVRSCLDMVLTELSFDSVFRYLKTDLLPLSRELVDELENYVLAHGIRGETWFREEPWRYTRRYFRHEDEESAQRGTGDEDEDREAREMDRARRKAMAAFAPFYRALMERRESLTAGFVSSAISEFLVYLKVPDILEKWREQAEKEGDLVSALEHSGVFDKVMEILEEAMEILGDEAVDLRTYALLINAGLEDIRLGVIPPSLDQVLVGSLDRSRQPECKVTFLLGALEGVFPRKHDEDSIFTDRERECLSAAGLALEPSSRSRQLHESYLVYIGLTRPSRRLYLSYPLADVEGKTLSPSHVVGWLKRVFPWIKEREVSLDPPGTYPEDLDFVVPARVVGITAKRLGLSRLGMPSGIVWKEAYRYLISSREYPNSRKVLSALGFTNKVEPLGYECAGRLYGKPLTMSASKLERFRACPFSYFASTGLGLEEREVFRLDPAGAGTFFHEALKRFILEIRQKGFKSPRDMSSEEVLQIMDRVVDRLVETARDEMFRSSARLAYVSKALKASLRQAAVIMYEHARRGQFVPVAAELPFGLTGEGTKLPQPVDPSGLMYPEDSLPPFRVEVPDPEGEGPGTEVLLRGVIDRIDALKKDGNLYVCVVDYKSSRHKIDFLDVFHGLTLQLLVYLLVATEALKGLTSDKIVPVGALYFTIHTPSIRTPGPVVPEEAFSRLLKESRMTGLLLQGYEILRLLDSASQEYSEVIPVRFTKDGVSCSGSVVTGKEFQVLLWFVKTQVRESAREILDGKIDVLPYRRGTQRACQYCPYAPLCGFDILIDGNHYRTLRRMDKSAIFEAMTRAVEGEKEGMSGEVEGKA